MLSLIFVIAACVVFLLAAIRTPSDRIDLIGFGLFLWALSTFVERLR